MDDLHQSSWTRNNFFLGFENQYLNPLSSQTQAEKETDWACAHNDDLMLLLLDEFTHLYWDRWVYVAKKKKKKIWFVPKAKGDNKVGRKVSE